jgi:hypothetical protein
MYRYEVVSGKGIPALVDKEIPLVGLEIGCDEGETSEYLLMLLPKLTLHAVDPYVEYLDWNGNYLTYRQELYNNVIERFRPYDRRFIMHRKTSDEAVNDFSDEQFDFIFIDGLHTYEQVLLDCKNYYPKLKKGGILFGHDYHVIEGVRKAVDEYASELQKVVSHTESDVWYWTK